MFEISVVVPTRNRAKNLEGFLESLTKQTVTSDIYEVLVIDNGSTDETEKVCLEWKGKIKNFKYIYDNNPGLHVGRNRGYQESSAEYIIFADDDICVQPEWIETILGGFRKYKDVVLIGGDVIPCYEEEPPKWVKELWIENTDVKMLLDYSCILFGGHEREINPYYVFGCNFAVRKSILDETRGFHPDGMPADLLQFRGDGESYVSRYIMDNKLKAYYLPGASVYHIVSKARMNIEYIKKIAFRNGVSEAYTILRNYSWVKLKIHIIREKINCNRSDVMSLSELKTKEYVRGMEFLMKEYEKKEIKEWIKRPDYLGGNGIVYKR